jgi:hypothetical protein
LVQDLLGQGTDQGLAPEWTAVVPFGAEDDLVDMEGAFGGNEYVKYYIHIRLVARFGWRAFAFVGAAEGAEGAELGEGGIFEDFEEVVFR